MQLHCCHGLVFFFRLRLTFGKLRRKRLCYHLKLDNLSGTICEDDSITEEGYLRQTTTSRIGGGV
jgi:hypothetical protein